MITFKMYLKEMSRSEAIELLQKYDSAFPESGITQKILDMFRKIFSKKYHPDTGHKGDELKDINAALDVLSKGDDDSDFQPHRSYRSRYSSRQRPRDDYEEGESNYTYGAVNGEEFVTAYNQNFESSSGTTPQWLAFFNFAKKYFRKILSPYADNLVFLKMHFEFSFFCTRKSDGQIFYLNSGDVRGSTMGFLIRTAEHYKDYTGGSNNFITVDENFEKKLLRFFKE